MRHYNFIYSLFAVIIEPSSSVVRTREPIIQGPTPTPTPVSMTNTTCSVLKTVAANAEIFECTSDTIEPCDAVYCSEELAGKRYSAVVVLLPCEVPAAAVRIELASGDGTVMVNETVDHSQEIKVPNLFGFSMTVTLDHFPDAIGLQVASYVTHCVCVCVCVCVIDPPCMYVSKLLARCGGSNYVTLY